MIIILIIIINMLIILIWKKILAETGDCIESKQQIFSIDIFRLWTSCIFGSFLAETSFIHIVL